MRTEQFKFKERNVQNRSTAVYDTWETKLLDLYYDKYCYFSINIKNYLKTVDCNGIVTDGVFLE